MPYDPLTDEPMPDLWIVQARHLWLWVYLSEKRAREKADEVAGYEAVRIVHMTADGAKVVEVVE